MQCRELFQEMAIDIIPPYMIAAKVGPLGYSGHSPMTTDPLDIKWEAAGLPEDPEPSFSIYNQGIRDPDKLRDVA